MPRLRNTAWATEHCHCCNSSGLLDLGLLSGSSISYSRVRLGRTGTNFNLFWVPPLVSRICFAGG